MKNKYVFGKNLRYSEYSSTDGGNTVYRVYGEDPNCDFGGSHHTPFLGVIKGTFKEVLEHAANHMSGFYQWGSGGHITPTEDVKVLDESEKIRKDRMDKLKNISKNNIQLLIDDIDNLTKEEIKEELKKCI